MRMKTNTIILKPDAEELLNNLATIVSIEDCNEYFYLPFWFEKVSEGNYIVHTFDNIPIRLKEWIKKERDFVSKKQV